MTPEERAMYARWTRHARKLGCAMQAVGDAFRLLADAVIRMERREWEHPELVLSDEERAAIEARQMGRTLAAIDDLPETPDRKEPPDGTAA